MITADEWRAYNDGVRKVSQGAEDEVIRRLLAWRADNPAATMAECREAAKLVMGQVVQSYDSVASSFAAEWYDYRAEQAGARLKQAVTSTVYSPKTADEVARYQAKKLAKGDFEGFARACGEYASNDALRSLNATIMANAKRDRREGVRLARVPTGRETCTFCLMLASRGAVYYTRASAGEFRHFHRRCDCKVVPGFEDDPMAELVEGARPNEFRRRWAAFKELDDANGMTSRQRDVAKRLIAADAVLGADEAIVTTAALPIAASPVFLNASSELYRRMRKVRPLDGYYDVMGHSDGHSLIYGDLNDVLEESGTAFTMTELKSVIMSDRSYKGGPIRVIACEAGRFPDGLAQRLADSMGAEVLAPTTSVYVDFDGRLTLAASMEEYVEIIGGRMREQGSWVTFYPRSLDE